LGLGAFVTRITLRFASQTATMCQSADNSSPSSVICFATSTSHSGDPRPSGVQPIASQSSESFSSEQPQMIGGGLARRTISGTKTLRKTRCIKWRETNPFLLYFCRHTTSRDGPKSCQALSSLTLFVMPSVRWGTEVVDKESFASRQRVETPCLSKVERALLDTNATDNAMESSYTNRRAPIRLHRGPRVAVVMAARPWKKSPRKR